MHLTERNTTMKPKSTEGKERDLEEAALRSAVGHWEHLEHLPFVFKPLLPLEMGVPCWESPWPAYFWPPHCLMGTQHGHSYTSGPCEAGGYRPVQSGLSTTCVPSWNLGQTSVS